MSIPWVVFIPVSFICLFTAISIAYLVTAKGPAKKARAYAEAHGWTYSQIVHLSWLRWARPIYHDEEIIENTITPFAPATRTVEAEDAVMGEIDGLKVVSFQMVHTKVRGRIKPYQHVVAVRLPFNEQPTISSDYLLREVMDLPLTELADEGLDPFVDVNQAWLILTAEQRSRAVDALNDLLTDILVEWNENDPRVLVDSDYLVTFKPGRRDCDDIALMAAPLILLIHKVPPALWDIRFIS